MKVLHVIPSVGPLRGGPSQIVPDLCRVLAQAGADITLVTTDDNGQEHLNVILGQTIEQGSYKLLYFRRTTHEYIFSWPITKWLAQHIGDYDFIHVHAVFSYAPLLAALFACLRGTPYAITLHGILLPWGLDARRTRVKRLSYALLEQHILNRAAFVHVTSVREAQELHLLNVHRPIEVIHFGLDLIELESITQRKLPGLPQTRHNSIQFLFLGRLHQIKGLDILLPAFAKALKQVPELELSMAGDGEESYKSWLHDEISRLGIAQNVLWLGFLKGNARWQALRECDALILPSYSESFGMVAVEAMACGKPVIVSDQVAIHDEIAQARAGLVVPCQADSLTDAVLQLVHNAELRQELGQNGKQLVEKQFVIQKTSGKLLDLYQKAIHSKH